MSEISKPLFVRLPVPQAERLDEVAAMTGKSKRQLVSDAVRDHLDEGGLVVGRVALREALPEVMTLAEAALLLRVDERAVEASAASGELPGRRLGDEWRFSHQALLAWLSSSADSPSV